MTPLLLAVLAAALALAAGVAVWLGARPPDAELGRRLATVAALLGGAAPPVAGDVQASIFRRRRSRSWLQDWVARRFCMLEGGRSVVKAAALGLVAAVGAVGVAVFLELGTLVPFLAPAAWVGASWFLLSLWDSWRRREFVGQFPEIVDHVVRLSRAGLPAVEAISVVSEEATEPVKGVLKQISDDLSSGLDPEEVLRERAATLRIPEFTLFSAALCLQRSTGGGISAALGNLSATLRARLELEMKAHASTSQTRMTLMVLAAVPVVVMILQNFTNPQALDTLLESPRLLRWGIGLVVGGLLAAHTIAARYMR